MEYQELRLMKLRGGNRWVPQEYSFSQWFHPGTAGPEGLTGPSFALTEDRKQVWLAGTVGGSPKVFTANANAEVAAAVP